jgi:hypothetical protein
MGGDVPVIRDAVGGHLVVLLTLESVGMLVANTPTEADGEEE